MNNLILWLGLLIIAFILVKKCTLFKNKNNKTTPNGSIKNNLENFFIEAFMHINMHNNLIENGTFEHGEEANDTVVRSQLGNEIIAYENPSPYTYVLHQQVSPTSDIDKVFYNVKVSVSAGNNYLLEYMDNTNSYDETGVELYTMNRFGEKMNISSQTKIVETMNFNGNKWVLVNQIFTIPDETDGYLYVSFQTVKSADETIYRYLAHIYLRRYLPLMPTYEFTKSLKLLLNMDASSLQVNQSYWKNLAGNNGNFKIQGNSQILRDGLYTRNITMITKNALSLEVSPMFNDNSFTIIFVLGSLPNDLIKHNEYEYESMLIPGNQQTAFSVKIPNSYGKINYVIADEEYITDKDIEPNVGNMLTFVYGNKTIKIYLNQILLEERKTKQVYFNVKDIILNTTGNWAANLKAVLLYNNMLLQENIVQIVNWFQSNVNNVNSVSDLTSSTSLYSYSKGDPNNTATASIMKHTMSNCLGSGSGSNDDCGCSGISPDWAYTSSSDPQYNEKLNNLRKCYLNKLKCPTAKYISGQYQITIPEKSLYSMKYNSYGVKNYGSNKNKARELYTENFPMCLVPDVLSNSNDTVDTTHCPFVVEKDNPCKTKLCEGVKWGQTKLMDLSQDCKNSINQYCKTNWDKDPACLCWNPKYGNEEGCLAFMKSIKDPKDIQIKEIEKPCCLNDYPITDHPDIKKYIKKNEIPCWGCNL